MDTNCAVTVAADGQIVLIDLFGLTASDINDLSDELPREQMHRSNWSSQEIGWLDALAVHVQFHLGLDLVESYYVDKGKALVSLRVSEGVDARRVKELAVDFLSLARYGIKIVRPVKVG